MIPRFFIFTFGRAPTIDLGAIFIIHPAPAFCQEEISTKINEKIFPQLCILTIVFYSWMWYYNNVKREVVSSQRNGKLMAPMGDCVKTNPPFQQISMESSPKEIKKLKKPLDNLFLLWYNEYIK